MNEPVYNLYCCGINSCCDNRNMSIYGNEINQDRKLSEQSTTVIASIYLILVFGLIFTDLFYLLFSRQNKNNKSDL